MGKLLLVVVVVILVYYVVRGYARSISRQEPSGPTRVKGENMLKCAHCGVHLPESEGIQARGRFYCSEEHRQLHGN